jgi:predicted NBD/HSP70 family sugar kinase
LTEKNLLRTVGLVIESTGGHALVRRSHVDRVRRVLQRDGALSRAEIAARTGISRTTISEITGSLLASRSITVVATDALGRSGRGRPAELLALDPSAGQFLGIDFGHRRVHVSIADASHDIIASGEARYPDDAQWPERLDALSALVDELQQGSGVHLSALQAVAVGVPGPFVIAQGTSGEGSGRSSAGRSLETELTERFGAAVVLDNNTRYAALAEAQQATDDQPGDVVYLRLGDVVGGRLVSGSVGLAGEFGHVRSVENGRLCRCGKHGCLETIASTPAILAACAARGLPITTVDELRAAVAAAHPVVDEIIRVAGVAVGRVLATASLMLNPAIVVVGGEVPRHAPGILRVIADTMADELSSTVPAAPRVRPAAYSGDEGSRGAIIALFHSSPLLVDYPDRENRARSTAP